MVLHVEVTFGSYLKDSDCSSVPSLLDKEYVSNVPLVSPGSYIQKIVGLTSRNQIQESVQVAEMSQYFFWSICVYIYTNGFRYPKKL